MYTQFKFTDVFFVRCTPTRVLFKYLLESSSLFYQFKKLLKNQKITHRKKNKTNTKVKYIFFGILTSKT